MSCLKLKRKKEKEMAIACGYTSEKEKM